MINWAEERDAEDKVLNNRGTANVRAQERAGVSTPVSQRGQPTIDEQGRAKDPAGMRSGGDRWIDGSMDRWINGSMDRWIEHAWGDKSAFVSMCLCIYVRTHSHSRTLSCPQILTHPHPNSKTPIGPLAALVLPETSITCLLACSCLCLPEAVDRRAVHVITVCACIGLIGFSFG